MISKNGNGTKPLCIDIKPENIYYMICYTHLDSFNPQLSIGGVEPFPEPYYLIIAFFHLEAYIKHSPIKIHGNRIDRTSVILLFIAWKIYYGLHMFYKPAFFQDF